MTAASIPRPGSDEYAPYYGTYVSKVPEGDVLALLDSQQADTLALLRGLPEARGAHRYAPDKWSIKEVIGHLCDSERVFGYRALRFARGDETPLASFDQNVWIAPGRFDARSLADLAAEFGAVRQATLALVRGLPAESFARRGTASGKVISVRALVYVIAGHERHHVQILHERYLRT